MGYNMIPILLFTFLCGTMIGSFLNVCIYRIPLGISIVFPRSRCPKCSHTLSLPELLPLIGFFLYRGHCRYCQDAVSPRYPLVELLSGFLWALLFYRFQVSFSFLCYAAFFSILLIVAFIDMQFYIIPNVLVLAALVPAAIAVVAHQFWPLALYHDPRPLSPLLGLIPGSLFFLAIHLLSALFRRGGQSIGMGDIKLFIPIGLILGFWQCVLAVFLAVLSGGLIGSLLLLLKKKKRKDRIPFGPFIVFGSLIALLIPISDLFSVLLT